MVTLIVCIDNKLILFLEFNYTFKWVDDGAYGFRNKETGEWNGLMGELLAQVGNNSDKRYVSPHSYI